MNSNNTPKYGFFYKSHGRWTGPLGNKTTTLPLAEARKAKVMKLLKSKVSIRKVS